MSRFAYIPHTGADIESMLEVIGASSVDELFSDIPDALLESGTPTIAEGLPEASVYRELYRLADCHTEAVSFLGGGCYDHLIPTTVPYIMSRSEFATAYTPYQAEISQGVLQAIFEFQTMVRMITGLPIPNASLYDGATAAVEACAMAIQSRRKAHAIAVSKTVHPATIQVLETYFSDLDIEIISLPETNGITDLSLIEEFLDNAVAALVVQTPNVHGITEDLSGLADRLHELNILLVVSSNPISLGALRCQGAWGADIAVGDAQPCGLPKSFGGPSVGYIAATEALMRKMPGRIVGETIDADGERAYVLTLQAREQHIKRSRATSNICTNQALAALGVAVYLATVGRDGFREISLQNIHKSHYLADRITTDTRATMAFDQPFFNEFVIDLPEPAERVVASMLEEGYFAGVPCADLHGSDENRMLVAVTERRTRSELDGYIAALRRVLT